MRIEINVDKVFLIKSVVVGVLLGLYVGVYKYAYNKGLEDMARYAEQIMQQQAQAPQAPSQQESARPGSDPFHELPGSSL